MAKTLKEPEVDPLARALDAAEQPARDREAAERAKLAEEQQTEQRRWGLVANETLAKLRPIAAELARWGTRGPEGAPLLRNRHFNQQTHEAVDRVFAQHRGLEEMVTRGMAQLQRWCDELAAPLQPERLGTIIEGVRAEANTWRSAESGLAASHEIRAQAVAQLAESRAAYDLHIRWFRDDLVAAAPLPREAA
jgi:hypothetical protein